MIKSHIFSITSKTLKAFVISIFGLSFSLVLCSLPAAGQDDQKEKAPEKLVPRLSLVSTQLNGDSILLTATVKVRIERSWENVDFVNVSFTVQNDSLTKQLGVSLTDARGSASIKVGVNELVTGEDGFWMFGVVFEGNEIATEGEAELSTKPAGITLLGEKKDSTYSLQFTLFNPGPEKLPIAEAEVVFFVKRLFSNLKIGEGTTDENGEAIFEFSDNIPGDMQGNIQLIARVDDLDEYGTVAAIVVKPWGTIPSADDRARRGLTSQAPPLWMLIVFVILMGVVWGHYIVIVYKLVKLRKPKIQNP